MTKAPKVYDIPASTRFRPCRASGMSITFVLTDAGNQMPVTADGISHYATCLQPKRFSKVRKAAA